MIWVQFAATALVIVLAGVRLLDTATSLAKRGGGRSWIDDFRNWLIREAA